MSQFLQAFPTLHEQLIAELQGQGIDIEAAMAAEDDGADYDSKEEIEDPGYVDPEDGEFKRPWCPATRILEHRENERIERCGPGMKAQCCNAALHADTASSTRQPCMQGAGGAEARRSGG